MNSKEIDETKRYKVLGKDGEPCNGGNGKWYLPEGNKPGKWMPKIENIVPCERGYHLCRAEDLVFWLNEEIYEAEGKGDFIRHDDNKDVFGKARLLRKVDGWNEKSARLFAADCAEHVLHIFETAYPEDKRPREAIQAARDYAMGKISKRKLYVAGNAAWAAPGNTAWAAWAAGRIAGEPAGDAARHARNAAWAAGSAECKWQSERLIQVLKWRKIK